jgi:MFS family permease
MPDIQPQAVTVEAASRRILWSSCLAMLAVGANSTAIMAALPSMRGALDLGTNGAQWAVNYLVVSAAFIVLGGRAADSFGTGRAAIAGLALFALASGVIAAAGSEIQLLAGRGLQGLAAAVAVPATLAAVSAGARRGRRAAAIAAWSGFLMLGFSIGPLFGGAVTEVAGWRAVFWLNPPLVLIATAGLAPAGLLPASSRHRPGRRGDWAGFVLLAVLMVSLVLALHGLPEAARAPIPVIVALAVAGAALLLLVAVEARAAVPLVDLGFFGRPRFVIGLVIGSLAMFSIMSLLFYFNLYAQSPDGLGLSALAAGASLLPLSAALLALALAASAIAARIGLANAVTGGMAAIAVGSAAIGAGVIGGSAGARALGLLVTGAGLALPYALASRLALSALPADRAGQGSGIVSACTFLGGSSGIAAGATALAVGGFPAVLTMIAAAAIVGGVVSRRISETAHPDSLGGATPDEAA